MGELLVGGCSSSETGIGNIRELVDVLGTCRGSRVLDGGGVDIICVWVDDTGRCVRDKAILQLLLG